jgi:hypothetical protein
MKKGKFPKEQKAMDELTKTLGHAWPRVHPNTWLFLAYKRRGRDPIWKEEKYSKETLPIYVFPLSQPFSLSLCQRIFKAKKLKDRRRGA